MSAISLTSAISDPMEPNLSVVKIESKGKPKKNQASEAVKKIHKSRIAYLTSNILDIARRISYFAHEILTKYSGLVESRSLFLNNTLSVTKLFEIALVPFFAVNLVQNVIQLIKGNRTERIDATVNIADDVGFLGTSISAFTIGLVTFEAISAQALKWASPLNLAASILSLARSVKNIRSFYKVRSLKQEIESLGKLNHAIEETSLVDFRSVLTHIKKQDAQLLQSAFNCKGKRIIEALTTVEKKADEQLSSSSPEKKLEAQQALNKTLKGLKNRISAIEKSTKLSVIASIIALIGAILLFVSPISVVAYGIVALATTLQLGNFIYHKVSEYRFSQHLDLQKKWYDWIL